ncbi:glucosyltransferase domain-containing protein [Flavobacterium azooxidireducens]|uniref:Glucosyltransferase domain-containing protein n=1 Tax=Flavobacterium azooxidireducens TaxID=1871076 RepID=A0ABY4KMR4_9FLAO|nr:glucosyltransferase domain-containing protein [Flavobacterium azooxidireducens]UPQ80527.1 glucosyltransferase domain-containing protein [Flavobacterium azooxidireducens]
MLNSLNTKEESLIKLFLFSFFIAIITYGFALTNFTLTIDNEIPIFPDYGLDLGRWGQNLIRYHLFKGHLQYFSLLLSLFLFCVAATRLTNLLKFQGLSAYIFCALFISFPQIAYQVVFGMMADIAALGVLLSVLSVELFLKSHDEKSITKKSFQLLSVALILMFTLSLYQAFIFVPAVIYAILFFQNTFKESFRLRDELKNIMLFVGVLVSSLIFYYISVKIICPPIEGSGYLSSFVSGESDNHFLNFCSIWLKNLVGSFYYGGKTFFLVSLSSLFLIVRFVLDKKHTFLRIISLFSILLIPFLMSSIITNGYHPPRLYLTSSLVFAFIIIFTINYFKINKLLSTKIILVIAVFTNVYFVTNLFYSANKIYKQDKNIAEKIDAVIQSKYPDFFTTEKVIYFYGYFPYEYHEKFRLKNSEIFGGSIFVWDNGNNYRIVNFFKGADVADYKMIDSKEKFDQFKDSINTMPIWPNHESIKMFNDVVVVKLGNQKGLPLYFE